MCQRTELPALIGHAVRFRCHVMTKTHRLQGRVLNGDAMPAWPMPHDVGPLQPTGKPGGGCLRVVGADTVRGPSSQPAAAWQDGRAVRSRRACLAAPAETRRGGLQRALPETARCLAAGLALRLPAGYLADYLALAWLTQVGGVLALSELGDLLCRREAPLPG